MLSSTLLVLLSAAAPLVAARTTSSIDGAEASCSAALDDYVTGIPSAPPKLLSFVATNTNMRMPEPTGNSVCDVAWPAEVQSDIRDYGASVLKWYRSHEQSISTLFSQCPEAKAYGYVSSCADIWATYGGAPNSAMASATATATATNSHSAHSTKASTTATVTSTVDGASQTAESSTFITSVPVSSSSSSSAAATTTTQEGAASRQTGMTMVAAAVAGLVAAAVF